jgi:hypothetical protein
LKLSSSSGNSATNDKYNAQSHKRSQKKMDIKRTGSQPSIKGLTDYFIRSVRIDPCSKQTIQRGQQAPVSHLSLDPVLRGIPIR